MIILIAVAYLVYSYQPLQVVHQPDDTEAMVRQVQHRPQADSLRSPYLQGSQRDDDR